MFVLVPCVVMVVAVRKMSICARSVCGDGGGRNEMFVLVPCVVMVVAVRKMSKVHECTNTRAEEGV
jgi:hypothetical protein